MAAQIQTALTILRRKQVEALTGLSRTTIYDRAHAGLMPKPVSLGGHAVGWPSDEVHSVIGAMIAGKSKDEIRTLVKSLEEARKRA
jgi:prophage regulatory protein